MDTNSYSYSHTFSNEIGTIKVAPILAQKATPFSDTVLFLNTSETIPVVISTTYLDFFDNHQPTDCPPSNCYLLESDCSTLFTDTDVTMASTSPWGIQAINSNSDLYLLSLCVKCEYETKTVTLVKVQTQVITIPW